jgi:hypothetical protein
MEILLIDIFQFYNDFSIPDKLILYSTLRNLKKIKNIISYLIPFCQKILKNR